MFMTHKTNVCRSLRAHRVGPLAALALALPADLASLALGKIDEIRCVEITIYAHTCGYVDFLHPKRRPGSGGEARHGPGAAQSGCTGIYHLRKIALDLVGHR